MNKSFFKFFVFVASIIFSATAIAESQSCYVGYFDGDAVNDPGYYVATDHRVDYYKGNLLSDSYPDAQAAVGKLNSLVQGGSCTVAAAVPCAQSEGDTIAVTGNDNGQPIGHYIGQASDLDVYVSAHLCTQWQPATSNDNALPTFKLSPPVAASPAQPALPAQPQND